MRSIDQADRDHLEGLADRLIEDLAGAFGDDPAPVALIREPLQRRLIEAALVEAMEWGRASPGAEAGLEMTQPRRNTQ